MKNLAVLQFDIKYLYGFTIDLQLIFLVFKKKTQSTLNFI